MLSDKHLLPGAVAKIICTAVDVLGYETRLPVSTCKTDAKGYYFSTLDHSLLEDGLKLRECKAFIESSPLEYCKVPTDVNKGITGALLSTYRILNDRKMKLYSINPFFYTTEPKSVPSGY
ncbi:hypothetical protein HS088_TW18G00094 [Tripterygium wilfordii]|uniref:Uncharacterized protein n=1 Tax=Tripterygium wilfordii TaxID=458696 RepID=A0A7J7CC16_TRIWF|nr:hypothetical protein HS088_TW18G00094 [Tripterygium wilfordii]